MKSRVYAIYIVFLIDFELLFRQPHFKFNEKEEK